MNEKAKRLRELVISKAEELGWSVSIDEESGTWEFENWSPAGEDFVVSVDGNNVGENLMTYYESFDPEEHVTDLLVAKCNGFRGVPDIKTLVGDADKIDDMLCKLACAIEEVEKCYEKEG